jgi:hypothetical protein
MAKEWLWEVEQLSPDEFPQGEEYLRVSKMLWAGSVASATEGDLPPQIIRAVPAAVRALEHPKPYDVSLMIFHPQIS